MLAAPLRKCIVTSRILPTSLMLQLKPVTLPNSTTAIPSKSKRAGSERIVMLPDQILHPKFARKKPDKGLWVTLDPRVYAQLHKKASYKIVSSEATLLAGMEELVERQLAERVVQEAELLERRFRGRRRLDLFDASGEGEDWAFSIQIAAKGEKGRDDDAGVLGTKPSFKPTFKDVAQADRFRSAMRGLTPGETSAESKPDGNATVEYAEKVYRARRSHLTAPLGIALYRLKMWTSSPAPASHSIVSRRIRSNS
uniref:Uncharacterized protein n=2 Tax=Kalmanozyma brasiliensis (strain GHG001) TaxID=1365824 RepID=V5GEX6_KALBG